MNPAETGNRRPRAGSGDHHHDDANVKASIAHLFAVSDERDLHLRRLLDAERAAYRAAYRDGYRAGRDDGYCQAARDWKVTAGLLPGGPSFAELETRRWGPGGRSRFGDPRPGDYPGGAA